MDSITNPTNERLREMILEKDQEIERLQHELRCEAAQADAYKERMDELRAKLEAIQQKASECGMHGECVKWLSEEVIAQIEERERLKKDAERYRKLKTQAFPENDGYKTERAWECFPTSKPEFTNLDQVIDALPESEKEA